MAGNSNRVFSYHVGAISRRKFNTAQIQLLSRRRAWITQFISFFSVFFFFSPQLTKNTFFRNHDQSPCGGDKRILVMPQCNLPDRPPYWQLPLPKSPDSPSAPRSPLTPPPSPLSPPPRRSIMAGLFYLDQWKQLTGNQTLKIELIFWIVLFYSYFH